MLTNTLKRLAFWARSTKKPQPSTVPSQSDTQQLGYSHSISPTLKKIDKRFNEAQEKAIQEQQMMMKGLEDFKHALMKDNEQRRKTKEEQIREAQKRLDSLEIPADLRQRFRQLSNNRNINNKQTIDLNTKTEQQDSEDNKSLNEMFSDQPIEQTMKKAKIMGNFKTEQQAIQAKKMLFQKEDPLAEHKLRQDMMIEQILKNNKSKEAELNLPKDWKREIDRQKNIKQQQSEILNEKLRYQKLKQLSAQEQGITTRTNAIESNSQLKRLDKLSDKYNIEISPDELWRQKYPPELIEKAIEYKNKELHYFKELIQGEHRHEWDAAREKGLMKAEKKDQDRRKYRKELIEAYEEKENQQLGATVTPVQEEGLTRYKDLDYYRQKGIQQFQKRQNLHEYDIELRQAANKDIKQLNKLSSIYLDEIQDPEEYRLQRKEMYEASTFGKYEIRLKQLSKKIAQLGIQHDFEDLALLKKEELFADKNMQEENASYQQYLIKKQKKKHMKEELKKIHKDKLRQDLNFDYEIDPVKLEKLDPVEMEQGLKKMEEIRRLKESTIVSSEFLKEKIHHTKTFKAMGQFISGYFYKNLQNPNNTITEKVQIGNILPNRKNTVLNVFWQFHSNYVKAMEKYRFNDNDIERQKATLQKILQKQANYISSKMTEYLGLRYGPDIRFYFNEILEQTKQSYNEMKKYKDEIIELTVEEYKEKGLIKTPEQEKDYRRKIQALATNNLQDLNNQKKLISKTFKKKQKITAKLQDRKEKKAKKQSLNEEQQNYEIKRKLSSKELQQMTLQKIITEKVQKNKESLFTPYIEDEQLVFGEKEYLTEQMRRDVGVKGAAMKGNTLKASREVKVERKLKRSPVERLWDEVEKGI